MTRTSAATMMRSRALLRVTSTSRLSVSAAARCPAPRHAMLHAPAEPQRRLLLGRRPTTVVLSTAGFGVALLCGSGGLGAASSSCQSGASSTRLRRTLTAKRSAQEDQAVSLCRNPTLLAAILWRLVQLAYFLFPAAATYMLHHVPLVGRLFTRERLHRVLVDALERSGPVCRRTAHLLAARARGSGMHTCMFTCLIYPSRVSCAYTTAHVHVHVHGQWVCARALAASGGAINRNLPSPYP